MTVLDLQDPRSAYPATGPLACLESSCGTTSHCGNHSQSAELVNRVDRGRRGDSIRMLPGMRNVLSMNHGSSRLLERG